MPLIKANGLDLFYDEFGKPNDPPILLIMGLGTQMVAWAEPFCEQLADAGFRVIRFDNRDIGLSTKMEGSPKINVMVAMARAWLGLKVRSPYTLDDLARDAIGLLDALRIDQAHIIGASMGGMIAQIVAAKFPQRVLSLTSIMSTSGDRKLPGPTPQARGALMARRPDPRDREAAVTFSMGILRSIGSPGFRVTDEELRGYVEAAMARSVYPQGFVRQFLAILANGSRVDLLKTIRAPTLVLHGEADPLVPVEGGRDTAKHIAGARLVTIPGWGHDLPPALYARLSGLISEHCRTATATA